jgi:hypothetical protein
MSTKKLTTISIAALATLGAYAASVQSASAGSIKISFGGGHHWNHHHWGHYPVYVSRPVKTCYFVKRFGELVQVCKYRPIYY